MDCQLVSLLQLFAEVFGQEGHKVRGSAAQANSVRRAQLQSVWKVDRLPGIGVIEVQSILVNEPLSYPLHSDLIQARLVLPVQIVDHRL